MQELYFLIEWIAMGHLIIDVCIFVKEKEH